MIAAKAACASTGTCAAAAAAAAAELWRGRKVSRIGVVLPDFVEIELEIEACRKDRNGAQAQVRKPHNGDPDATREAIVQVRIVPGGEGIRFLAGRGVGTVTKAGLQLAVGEPAINPVPREQIRHELRSRGLEHCLVVVSVPGGEEIAKRTFNAKLGVMGGISILGTGGRVRPFSDASVVATVLAHLAVVRSAGYDKICLVPGRMGAKAAARHLGVSEENIVEVSNFWGEAIDGAKEQGFSGAVLVGHPGKLGKLVQGQWNTHSSAGSDLAIHLQDKIRQWGFEVAVESETVDGLLSSLDAADRNVVSDRLAHEIALAARRRSDISCRVLLCGYDGTVMGRGEG